MNANKKYLSDITKKDLEEIAAAANAHGGDGIDVVPTNDGLEISIDRGPFTRWVKTIMSGGNI